MKLTCPYCEAVFDWIVGEQQMPRPGDACGCVACGEVAIFTLEGDQLRSVTDADRERFGERVTRQVATFKRQVMARQRARTASLN